MSNGNERDSFSAFLSTINLSPIVCGEPQEKVLLERALSAFRKSVNRVMVDVPVAISSMPCCGAQRNDRTSTQAGTVWRLSKRGAKIVHEECGKEIKIG